MASDPFFGFVTLVTTVATLIQDPRDGAVVQILRRIPCHPDVSVMVSMLHVVSRVCS